jgi:Rrf2 family protein
MLSIKRETDYAIRCVYYLSCRPDQVTMVDEIAREMSIPKSFLAKILQKLAKDKIVKSYVGVKGGFFLAKAPADITLFDVIVAVEGAVAMNRCTVNKKECVLSSKCKVHPIWISVRREVEAMLKKKTFGEIAG